MTLKGVQVCDTLFTVAEKRDGSTVLGHGPTVTKVGRRWATTKDHGGWSPEQRFDITTGHKEDPYPYLRATAFRTEAEALAHVADVELRAELRPVINRHIDRWRGWPTDLQVRLRDLIEEAGETQPWAPTRHPPRATCRK